MTGYLGYGVRPANGDAAWLAFSVLKDSNTAYRDSLEEIRKYIQFLEGFHYEQTHKVTDE